MFGRNRSTTLVDLVHRSLYACLGLHTGFERKHFLQKLTFGAWLVVHSAGCVSISIWWLDVLTNAGTRSLSTFTQFGSEVVFIGALLSFEIQIHLRHDEIESLIRRNGRRLNELIPQLTFWAPFGLIGLRRGLAATDTATRMKEVYFAVLELSVMVLFLISGDVVMNLKSAHADLIALTANIEAEQNMIRWCKWTLRDRLHCINEIFSWTWGAYYALTFNMAVFVVNEVVGQRLSLLEKTITLMGDVLSLVRLYRLAEGGSSLTALCLKAEAKILSADQIHGTRKDTPECLIPTMVYREEWDSLQAGCSSLETRKFLSFLATSVTCSAVVLQFDYHVVQHLTQMSMQNSAQ